MGKEQTYFVMEMFTQESTKRGSQMGRVSTVGEMAKFMLVNSSKE